MVLFFLKQIKSLVFILIQLKNSTVYHFTSHHPQIYIFFSLFELLDSLQVYVFRSPPQIYNPNPSKKTGFFPFLQFLVFVLREWCVLAITPLPKPPQSSRPKEPHLL